MRFVAALFMWGTMTVPVTSCYMGKKIAQPLVIHLDRSTFITEAVSLVSQAKYLDIDGSDGYADYLLRGLAAEASQQVNITLTDVASEADYVLKLDHFEVTESVFQQTVNDEKSPYNGQTYFLSKIDGTCTFEILKGDKKLGTHTADVSKEEDLRNGQTLFQLAVGLNKDHTQYREKLLPADVCYAVAEKCGQRTWNLFTQKLAKKLK